MVYCGKPSRGCGMCRKRRIKCDEGKPVCAQCTKSKRECPGYKDEFDLVFRNETVATEARALKAKQKKNSQKPDSASKTSTAQDIIALPALPLDKQADWYFLSNFVMTPSEGTRGFADWVLPLTKAGPPTEKHLRYALKACGLALLNNRAGSFNRLNPTAISNYTKALAATNDALRDPKSQYTDATLAAVLLLGTYENITARKIGTLSWGSHIQGAMQIVKARGRKQLETEVGKMLFISVRAMMIIHAITSGSQPPMGADWWIADAVRDESSARCQRFAIKAAEIRAGVARIMSTQQRTQQNSEEMMNIIRRCGTLDREIQAWMQDQPPKWQCHTACWIPDNNASNCDYSKLEIFPGRVDMFTDLYVASVWSLARTTRMLMATTVMRCIAWVVTPTDYKTTPQYAVASDICRKMVEDIIASVPYHFGLREKLPHLSLGPDGSNFACGDNSGIKGLAGYFAVWPLGHIYHSDFAKDKEIAWVGGRLKYIGEELGIRYALVVRGLKLKLPSGLIRADGYRLEEQSHNILGIMQGSVPPPPGTTAATSGPNSTASSPPVRASPPGRQSVSETSPILPSGSSHTLQPGGSFVAQSSKSMSGYETSPILPSGPSHTSGP